MNRARIADELPPNVAAYAGDDLLVWDALARHAAVAAGRTLLDGQEEFPDEDQWRRDGLQGHSSPAVRALALKLHRDRHWTAHSVASALAAHFELFGVADWLRRELKSREASPNGPQQEQAA